MGDAQIISGFVHPPTEIMFQVACYAWNQLFYNREGIRGQLRSPREARHYRHLFQHFHETLIAPLERLHLVPRDYGFGKNVPSARLLSWWKRCSPRQTFRTDANRSLERRILLVA